MADNKDEAIMFAALEEIAHYCDNPDNMDDPYCADGHILASKAKDAIEKLSTTPESEASNG